MQSDRHCRHGNGSNTWQLVTRGFHFHASQIWKRTSTRRMAEEKETTAKADGASTSIATASSSSMARDFSWLRWSIITCALATLAGYFIRRSPDMTAAAIKPTKSLDARIGFTPTTALETLRALGPEGRKIYKEINMVDFIMTPIVLNAWLNDTFRPRSPHRATLRWMLSFVYMFGDISENVCVAIMLRIYPRFVDAIAWACCVGNLLKWSGFAAALLSIVYEAILEFRDWQAKRKAKKA
jgi:hypothetical protein